MVDNEKIETIKKVVAKAEKQLAHVRQYAHGTEVPTINELRYTLHHLLCHLTDNDEDQWQKSHRHARRAVFDAYDAEAQFLATKFLAFEEQHADMVIAEVVPAVTTWRQTVAAYAQFSRDTSRDNREEYYGQLEPHLAAMRPIISQLQQASDDLNKKRQTEFEKRTREIRILRWTIVGATLVFITLAATLGIEYYKNSKEKHQNQPAVEQQQG